MANLLGNLSGKASGVSKLCNFCISSNKSLLNYFLSNKSCLNDFGSRRITPERGSGGGLSDGLLSPLIFATNLLNLLNFGSTSLLIPDPGGLLVIA